MKQYKFIGTKKDLIDNNFVVDILDVDIKAIKRTNEGNVFVSEHNQVLTFNERLIQDLIDKGLVVEIKESEDDTL